MFKAIVGSAIASALLFSAAAFNAGAQDLKTKEDFSSRYNLLISRVGPDGVGVETLLDKWEAAFPDDMDMCLSRFSFFFAKARSSTMISSSQSKYLGHAPVFSLSDSLGKPVNYFEDITLDDELFGQAMSYIDKAINVYPERLDLRFIKSAAYLEYEKGSPDMTLSFLKGLVDYSEQNHIKWTYDDEAVSSDDFVSMIQDYCISFYQLGTDGGYEAFKSLSEKMVQYYPKNTVFLGNIGTYYFIHKKDYKAAQKQYNSVLKIKPDDYGTIKNLVLMARNQKNTKQEKKYLQMLIKYTDNDAERTQAQTRLSSL